ncbi:hypothetical protein [Geodermatophilus sp. URMC 64]
MTAPRGRTSGTLLGILRIVGALLLLALAGIHFYLWQQGYDTIPTIGPAFLLDTICGVGGAVLVLVSPLRWLPIAAALGALLCIGTLGGLIVSTTVGLFGFKEVTSADLWWGSAVVEAAGFVVLAALVVVAARRRREVRA